MTKELIYAGNVIRIEQAEGVPVTPVADIAKAIGYDPHTLARLVRRDPILKIYEAAVMAASCTPKGGSFLRPTICLKKDGVAGLLVKLNSSRIKDAEKRAKVQAFQKWAITTLRDALDAQLDGSRAQHMSQAMAETVTEVMQEVAKTLSASSAAINHLSDFVYNLSARVDSLENQKKPSTSKTEDHPTKRDAGPTMDEFFQHRPENLARVSRDVREFLSISCVIDPDAATNLAYLYIVYENWAASNCQLPMGRNKFYDQIRYALNGIGEFVLNRTKLYARGLRLRSVARSITE